MARSGPDRQTDHLAAYFRHDLEVDTDQMEGWLPAGFKPAGLEKPNCGTPPKPNTNVEYSPGYVYNEHGDLESIPVPEGGWPKPSNRVTLPNDLSAQYWDNLGWWSNKPAVDGWDTAMNYGKPIAGGTAAVAAAAAGGLYIAGYGGVTVGQAAGGVARFFGWKGAGGAAGGAGKAVDQAAEQIRQQALGWDPDIQKFRQNELDGALRLETYLGSPLKRSQGPGDFIGPDNTIYDLVGPFPTEQADKVNMQEVFGSIQRHVNKEGVDKTVIDLTGLSQEQIDAVTDFISKYDPKIITIK